MTIEEGIKDEDMKAIEELRQRFEGDMEPEIHENDYYFLRFLVARDMNIDKAEIMLRKHLEWKKKHDIDNLLKTYNKPNIVEKYFPFIFIGHDKEGCVVRYCPAGNIDTKGLVLSLKVEELRNAVIYELGKDVMELKRQSIKLNRNVGKVIYIVNVKNLSSAQVFDKKSIIYFTYVLKIFIHNFPEMLKAVYILNASYYFTFIYSFMKTILPSTIMEKIHLYSNDSFKEDLLQVIGADELPAFLGGNKTDPDGNPLCTTYINHGGEEVPKNYYIRANRQPLSNQPGVKQVTVPRAVFLEVDIEVAEPGSYLEWEFETKSNDIGFGVFYREMVDGEEHMTKLIPIQRTDTEEYPETGMLRCEKAGSYVIVFDNTYSWARAKEIFYRTKLVTPKERETGRAQNN